jgi:hypothetical protein
MTTTTKTRNAEDAENAEKTRENSVLFSASSASSAFQTRATKLPDDLPLANRRSDLDHYGVDFPGISRKSFGDCRWNSMN